MSTMWMYAYVTRAALFFNWITLERNVCSIRSRNESFQSVWIDFLKFVEQPKESKRKFFILPILDLSIDKVDSICQFYEKKKYKISIWFINLIVTMESQSHIFMVTICGFILFRILFPRIFPTPRHLYAWIAILLLLNVHLLIEKSSLTKNSNSRE